MTEEFNKLADADYPIAELARKLGRPMAQLRKDMEAGTVSANEFFAAHHRTAGVFAGALDRKAVTSEGASNRLSQKADDLSESVVPGGLWTGAKNLLARSMDGWAAAFRGPEGLGRLDQIGRPKPPAAGDGGLIDVAAKAMGVTDPEPTTVRGNLDKYSTANPFKDPWLFPNMPAFKALAGDAALGKAVGTIQDAAGKLMGHVGKLGDAVGGLVGAGAEFRKKLEADAAGPKSAIDDYHLKSRQIDAAALGGLSPEAANLGRVNAFLDLEKSVGPLLETRLPAAMSAASVEAESTITRAMNGSVGQSADDRVKAAIEAGTRQGERIEREIKNLSDALLRQGFPAGFNP